MKPPSAMISAPVAKRAWSKAVKRMKLAISSGRRCGDGEVVDGHDRVAVGAVGEGCFDDAGVDGVDADVAAGQSLGGHAHEAAQCPLAAAVGDEFRGGREPGDGVDVDDRAASCLAHGGGRGADAEQGAGDVRVEHALELVERDALHVAHAQVGGVVDQDVQMAEACFGLVDHVGPVGLARDVEPYSERGRRARRRTDRSLFGQR
nr:hypothetical protein [Streptomyces endocoffeicus]